MTFPDQTPVFSPALRCIVRLVVVMALVAATATPVKAEIKVVTTTPDLAALVMAVGGSDVSVTSLSLPTQDPHFVDAKPSLALKLNKADLLIVNGLDLEIGWLPVLQQNARNPKIKTGGVGYLDCSKFVKLLEVPTTVVDRSQGDIHPGGNPHYLHAPEAAAGCASGIAAKLVEIDPARGGAYQKRVTAFSRALHDKRHEWEQRLAKFRGMPVVTYHQSWSYVIAWLGLDAVATLEPKPGIPPSPSHVARVLKLAQARGVKVILQESYYPDKTGKLVASKIAATPLTLRMATDPEHEDYLGHMEWIVGEIEKALSK